jgi:hypothetical protein
MTLGDVTLTGEAEAQQLSGLRVTHTFLPVLAMKPELGRNFLPEEDVPGGDTQVAILSAGFWTRQFGADPEILDRTIQLDGRPFQVVGVAPTDQAWPGVDVFTPLAPDATTARDNHTIAAVGRLAPGVSFADARTDMVRIAAELASEYPEANEGWSADLMTAEEWRIGDRLTRLGLFLMGAVTLLLLMACGSVSNILVARATTRQREIGLRAALGAGRTRIMGQLVTEMMWRGLPKREWTGRCSPWLPSSRFCPSSSSASYPLCTPPAASCPTPSGKGPRPSRGAAADFGMDSWSDSSRWRSSCSSVQG